MLLIPVINKGRFCNSISRFGSHLNSKRLANAAKILSSRSSKQMKPQSCPETSTANSRLVRAKGGFQRRNLLITKEDG